MGRKVSGRESRRRLSKSIYLTFFPPSSPSSPSQRVVDPSSLSIDREEEEEEEEEEDGEALDPWASSKQRGRERKKQKVRKLEGVLTMGRAEEGRV
jgi:hypothetical protein